MTANANYQDIYNEAEQYLLSFDPVEQHLLDRHLNAWNDNEPTDLFELYHGLLKAAKTKRGMPNSIGEIQRLDHLLHGFSPQGVVDAYDSWKDFFHTLEQDDYDPPGPLDVDNPRSYWVQFSKSIISGARFLSRFDGIQEFNEFTGKFTTSEYTRFSLPLLLREQIHGLGFALGCEFLKENGYPRFVKPDVHLKEIFFGLDISDADTDFEVFVDIIRFAEKIEELPYRVDKLFWLVGSGRFYLESPVQTIMTDKQDFIERVQAIMK